MCDLTDYAELVKKAQLGDRGSLDRLAEAARVRLHEYVFRLTLDEDLTGDILQESILEMLRIFGKLRRAEKFWPWLCGIAFNKVRNHYGKSWRRKTRAFSETGYEPEKQSRDDTLAEVVTDELKHIVLRSVEQLSPSHRAVLTMRCYDHLSYAEIARLVGCSEIGARALFCRAKKSLARRLADYGLGKGSLVLALVVFGKVTAANEATAAQVAVSAATLEAGPLAALLAAAGGKTGLIVLATAGTLAVGIPASIGTDRERAASAPAAASSRTNVLPAPPWQSQSSAQQECWYYFPSGGSDPVMMRLVESGPAGENPACRVLQNQYANYLYDARGATVHITNHRIWKPDLSVMRLPTDPPAFSDFLSQVEGHTTDIEPITSDRRGLLVIAKQQRDRDRPLWHVERHLNVLNEEYFLFSWPDSVRMIDERDAMHQQGWAYFEIAGQVAGRIVSGAGRLPLVYAAIRGHYPWLKLSVGGRPAFVDTPAGARIYDDAGRISARLAPGSFFAGLPRPWMGLHTLDTVRRDAAEQRLRFDTAYDRDTGHGTVTVYAEGFRLVYTVNVARDVVEAITLLPTTGDEFDPLGELRFTYYQDAPEFSEVFTAPPNIRSGSSAQPADGILWLKRLAERR
ncbi:MAG: RNA polymerase sigma factor [Sedimentisphaerales bacterium]|nr:RNA polymerase sigma factor [Sedimentisphaerales bacterium]